MSNGIVLLGEDKGLAQRARGKGESIKVDPNALLSQVIGMPFDKTLFVEPGTEVPWDLLPAGWHFLDRWDAAVPLWRYGITAAQVGSKNERKRTQEVIRDLRVLLHAVELLFVRDSKDGRALLEAYGGELQNSGEKRLAFLRAMYQVKPRVCILPRSWLAKIYERSKLDARALDVKDTRHTGPRLIQVEIAPGRFVKCNPGDEERVRAMLTGGRHG